MNYNRLRTFVIACGLLIVGSTLQSTAWGQGGGTRELPVVVTNTAESPVQVGNTPNRPLTVRDVDGPAGQPFQSFFSVGQENPIVPAGKRLVIEYASMTGSVPDACYLTGLRISVLSPVTGPAGAIDVPVTYSFTATVGTSIRRFGVAGQRVRLYADAGSTVRLTPWWVGQACVSSADVGISGYLVDLP